MEKPTMLEKIGKAISYAGNTIMMNLLFLAACLPIVTIGQAWCGLLTAVRYQIRGDKWTAGFKKGFLTRFWRGTILWLVMGPVCVYFALMLFANINAVGLDVPTVASGVVFALMAMVTFSLQLLNIYVPTALGQWLRNGVNMVFKAPIEMLGAVALIWLPALLFLYSFPLFYYVGIVFVAVYFSLVATVATLVLKNALLYYLLEARSTDTLLEDDSNWAKKEEEDEE